VVVAGQFDVEAALRRHWVRQLTDKLAATAAN
jgi:transposase-like protein